MADNWIQAHAVPNPEALALKNIKPGACFYDTAEEAARALGLDVEDVDADSDVGEK